MKQMTNKEYEKYEEYKNAVLHGQILTPDGLRLICAAFENDPEKSESTRLPGIPTERERLLQLSPDSRGGFG